MAGGRISRRRFLAAVGATGAAVAACAPTISPSARPSPTRSPAGPSPTAAPSSPRASELAGPAVDVRRLIAGLLVVGFRGLTTEEAAPVARAIERDGLGGVILFDRDQLTGGPRNVASADQVRALIGGLQALATDRTLIVAIDQEGGRVTRLGPEHGFPEVESQAEVGASDDPDAIEEWAAALAGTLAEVGVNLNLAPVVDVNVNPDNPAIGALDRSFSADPAAVGAAAIVEVTAHHAADVRTCLKHFPGLGSATANTDFGVADVTGTWSEDELLPFRTVIDAGIADAVMAGHLVNRDLDPDLPASLSVAIVDGLLRTELGWDGVVVTDDLQAAAITDAFGDDEAIAFALAAGNDLLLFANQQTYDDDLVSHVIDVIERLVAAGTVSVERLAQSRRRIDALFASG